MPIKGFVDLQVNGGWGINFSESNLKVEDVADLTEKIVEEGTIAYCPTVCTASQEVYKKILPAITRGMENPEIELHIPGMHMEACFFNPKCTGAHPTEHLCNPSIEIFKRWQGYAEGKIRILTLAPELPGAMDLIEYATREGVVVSLGHHYADSVTIAEAARAGARASTHLGNGLPMTLPRHPNPIWSQLANDDLVAMFIMDGHHLDEDTAKVSLRAKGLHRSIIVSDMAAIAKLSPGDYEQLETTTTIESSGKIVVKDSDGRLAGSSATMRECANWLASKGLLAQEKLEHVGFYAPCKLLGIDPTRFNKYEPLVTWNGERFDLI